MTFADCQNTFDRIYGAFCSERLQEGDCCLHRGKEFCVRSNIVRRYRRNDEILFQSRETVFDLLKGRYERRNKYVFACIRISENNSLKFAHQEFPPFVALEASHFSASSASLES